MVQVSESLGPLFVEINVFDHEQKRRFLSSGNDGVSFRNSAEKYYLRIFFEDLDLRIKISGLDFQESYQLAETRPLECIHIAENQIFD